MLPPQSKPGGTQTLFPCNTWEDEAWAPGGQSGRHLDGTKSSASAQGTVQGGAAGVILQHAQASGEGAASRAPRGKCGEGHRAWSNLPA